MIVYMAQTLELLHKRSRAVRVTEEQLKEGKVIDKQGYSVILD